MTRRLAAGIALSLVALAAACRKPAEQADPPAGSSATLPVPSPPSPPPSLDAAPLVIPEGTAMDLRHADRVTADLTLTPAGREMRYVQVPAGRNVVLEVIQTAQATGRLTLTIHDADQPGIPISDDSMTCVEPECKFNVEVKAADAARTLLATCTSSVDTTIRLEARMVPANGQPGG